MKKEFNKENFMAFMRRSTSLSEGSIYVYSTVIEKFYEDYGKLTKKNIQEYISRLNRDGNCVHVRAPFKHLFRYYDIDKEGTIYRELPLPKRRPKKRQPTFLDYDILKRIIYNIKEPIWRDLSIIRLYTGTRAEEAMTIKEEKMRKYSTTTEVEGQMYTVDLAKIMVKGKGGRERAIYLRKDIAEEVIKPYVQHKPGFLFLPRELALLEEENKQEFWRKMQVYRTRYYEALNRSAQEMGLPSNYGTHNIRRAFAETLRQKVKDISIVQKALGHKNIATTMLYFDDNEENTIKAVMELQGIA